MSLQQHLDATHVQARVGDYMSKIAWLAGVPLDAFMMDNVANVKDLDGSLEGKRLLVCNPEQGGVQLCHRVPDDIDTISATDFHHH